MMPQLIVKYFKCFWILLKNFLQWVLPTNFRHSISVLIL